jgi:hypothetical protein
MLEVWGVLAKAPVQSAENDENIQVTVRLLGYGVVWI